MTKKEDPTPQNDAKEPGKKKALAVTKAYDVEEILKIKEASLQSGQKEAASKPTDLKQAEPEQTPPKPTPPKLSNTKSYSAKEVKEIQERSKSASQEDHKHVVTLSYSMDEINKIKEASIPGSETAKKRQLPVTQMLSKEEILELQQEMKKTSKTPDQIKPE